jgi:predicted transcriptional regulator
MKNKMLGPLEQNVMECVWNCKRTTVREVHSCLKKDRKIAYTTVMTIMSRLTEKGYLKRGMVGNRYIYIPSKKRASFIKKTLSTMAKNLMNNFGEEAILTFIDELDKQGLSEEKKKELIAKLQNENNN